MFYRSSSLRVSWRSRPGPPRVAEGKPGPTAAGLSERFSEPCSFARRLQDIESDTGYDTRRRVLDGVLARVSQTAVYDTYHDRAGVVAAAPPARVQPADVQGGGRGPGHAGRRATPEAGNPP